MIVLQPRIVVAMSRSSFRRFDFFDVETITDDVSVVLVTISSSHSSDISPHSDLPNADVLRHRDPRLLVRLLRAIYSFLVMPPDSSPLQIDVFSSKMLRQKRGKSDTR